MTDDSLFLTVGKRAEDDPTLLTVTRDALAVPFALGVLLPKGQREVLIGASTCVAVGLGPEAERRGRVWLDLGMSRDDASERLHEL